MEKQEECEKWLNDVRNKKMDIRKVPDEWRNDFGICLAAVSNDGLQLEYVPSEIDDQIENYPEYMREGVYKNHKRSIYEYAVYQNGFALKFVPECFVDFLICKIAVEQNPYALKFVPKNFKTEELCLTAVLKDLIAVNVLEFVPPSIKTPAFFKKIIERIPIYCEAIEKKDGKIFILAPNEIVAFVEKEYGIKVEKPIGW